MREILGTAWRIYRQNFRLLAIIVLVVWTPLELLSCYMDAHVFGENEFRKSFKFGQFLDNFVGIIAGAAIMLLTRAALFEQEKRWSASLIDGLNAWGRMWWSRMLYSLAILVGFLCLILPGFYLAVRLCFVEQVAVLENISGMRAFSRSFELTENRFWYYFRLILCLVGMLLLAIFVVLSPSLFTDALDHWLIDAAFSLAIDILVSFWTVAFTVAYLKAVEIPPPLVADRITPIAADTAS